MEFGLPKSWQKQMVVQDFDPTTASLNDFIAFCERMERVEDVDGTKPTTTTTDNKSPKYKSSSKSGRSKRKEYDGDTSKECMLHGRGSHSTEECKVLKNQAKKMKATYDA